MRRTVAILMIVSFIMTASCGKAPEPVAAGKTEGRSAVSGDVSETAAETELADGLPHLDFEGISVNVIAEDPAKIKTRTPNIDVQEMDGEVFNDAVYVRNRSIEERLGLVINETYPGNTVSLVKKSVLAGSDEIDLASVVDREGLTLYSTGMIYGYEDIPYIDLAKAYWDQGTLKEMTIGGRAVFAYGAMNMTAFGYTGILAYNKDIADSFAISGLYNTVFDGKWTLDYMESTMKLVQKDINGDGLYSDGDVFALSGRGDKSIPPLWIASGVKMVNKDDGDLPVFTVTTDEKFQTVFLRAFDIYIRNQYWCDTTDSNGDKQAVVFINGGSLYFSSDFNSLGRFIREMESDFGVLPYPKYDEKQENYISRVECGFPNVVPTTCKKLEAVGAFLEAASCSAYKSTVPAYYETVLKDKLVRDEESKKMLDLIFGTRSMDLGDTYWYASIRSPLTEMFSQKNNSIASASASMSSSVNSTIQGVISAIDAKRGS